MIFSNETLATIHRMTKEGYKPSAIGLVCGLAPISVKRLIAETEAVPPLKQYKAGDKSKTVKYPTPSKVDDMQYHCHCDLPDDPYDAIWDWAEDSYNNPGISIFSWRSVLRMY